MERYRIKPGSRVRLRDHDPDDKGAFEGDKAARLARGLELAQRIEALQEALHAEGKHKMLVVLQAMDTGGKDGTIRHVFDGVNPTGVKVASFKKPTALELGHDFLWRIHPHAPANGEIVIFNRSHYEDVLVVRVHGLVPKAQWKRRYEHINAFEKLLSDEGTRIVKLFLHISKQEQRERLEARVRDPAKHWKFDPGDLAERERWDEYVEAYEAALSETSTKWAPWHVVPANSKTYRNLVVSQIIVDALEGLEIQPPRVVEGLEKLVIE